MNHPHRIFPDEMEGRLLGGMAIGMAFLLSLVVPLDARAQQVPISDSTPRLRIGAIQVALPRPADGEGGLTPAPRVRVPVFLSPAPDSNYISLSIFYEDFDLIYGDFELRSPHWVVSPDEGFRKEYEGLLRGVFLHESIANPYAVDPGDSGNDVPGGGNPGEEELIFEIVFALVDNPDRDPDLLHVTSPVGFTPALVEDRVAGSADSFVGVLNELTDEAGNRLVEWRPTDLESGSVTIYYHNFVEVGSGEMTRARQIFTLPLYLTYLRKVNMVAIGVDYDELIFRGIRPVGELVVGEPNVFGIDESLHYAEFGLNINGEAAGDAILRKHVADLVFEYRGDLGPEIGALRIIPHLLEGKEPGGEGVGAEVESRSVPGTILFVEPHFVRGNVDSSRRVGFGTPISEESRHMPSFTDAFLILNMLFGGRPEPLACVEAGDVNDDGMLELTDAVHLLNYLFLSGDPPAAPFPLAGPDNPESPAFLGCDTPLPYFSPRSSS